MVFQNLSIITNVYMFQIRVRKTYERFQLCLFRNLTNICFFLILLVQLVKQRFLLSDALYIMYFKHVLMIC
jgi:hypothetical protein